MKKAEKKITLESMSGKVDALATTVESLAKTVKTLASNTTKGFKTLSVDLKSLEKRIDKKIDDKIDALAMATAKGFAETATKEELRGVTEQLSSLENRLAEVELISR